MNPAVPIRLLDHPASAIDGKKLAGKLGIPLVSEVSEQDELLLHSDANGRLGIAFATELPTNRSDVHHSSAWFRPAFTTRHPARGRDPLMRAVGYKTRTLLDCTAGWGVDAAHIARHGISVTALERHPVVAALLESALRDSTGRKQVEGLDIVIADSSTWLRSLANPVEVIYIDPMYPPRPGSAAPRRPMRILQALTAEDGPPLEESLRELIGLARRCATRRVVVKRPHYAAPGDNDVSGSIPAKLVRFDLYPPIRSEA